MLAKEGVTISVTMNITKCCRLIVNIEQEAVNIQCIEIAGCFNRC